MKRLVLAAAVLLLLAVVIAPVFATGSGEGTKDWPTRDVTIVVPFAAGGVTDLTTRLMAQSLQSQWGVNVVVENKPGGSSLTGISAVIHTAPDGYTMVCNSPTVVITQYTTDTFIPMSDYTPLCKVADSFCTMSIRTDLPYKTMAEFFDAVRKAPGKFTMAISGTKSIWYALARELEQTANLKFTYIPYDGGAPAAAAVAGGHVDCCMIDMATILSLYKAGTLKVIGYFGKERNPLIPDAQTAIEIGFPKLTLVSWFGIVLPNGVDKKVMNKISSSIKVAMNDPKIVEFFKGSGAGTVNGYMPQDEFIPFMKKLDAMYKVFFTEEKK